MEQHQRILQLALEQQQHQNQAANVTVNTNANNNSTFSALLNSTMNHQTAPYYHQQYQIVNNKPAMTTTNNLDYYMTGSSSDKIRQFVNEILLGGKQPQPQSQPQQQQPSLPQNPPPSLTATTAVQYSSPWNSSSLTTKITSASNSLVSNLTGNSTLSGRLMPNNQMMSSSQDTDDNVNGK